MTHCIKLFNLTVEEKRRARTIIEPYMKEKYGVKATFLKRVVYVHLDENQAYSVILAFFSRLLYRGKLTATKKNMDWLKGFKL